MKKLLTLCLLFSIGTALSAQITVTNATFPAIGDTLRLATDFAPSGVEITAPGGPFDWDFSELAVGTTQVIAYRPASEGSAAAEVPNANLFADLGGESEGYYKITNTAFEWLALNGPDPIGVGFQTLFKFSPPLVERHAPLGFPSAQSAEAALLLPLSTDLLPDTIVSQFPFPVDSIRIKFTSERTDFVDAFGKLAIPGGNYDVLREKRTEFRDTRLEVKLIIWLDITDQILNNFPELGKDTIVTYNFFNDVEKEPIAIVTMDDAGTTPIQVVFKDNGVLDAVDDVKTDLPELVLLPNPAASSVKMKVRNLKHGAYSAEIIAVNGEVLQKRPLNVTGDVEESLDLSGIHGGLYFVRLLDHQGVLAVESKLLKAVE
jgi:hypothetical protein